MMDPPDTVIVRAPLWRHVPAGLSNADPLPNTPFPELFHRKNCIGCLSITPVWQSAPQSIGECDCLLTRHEDASSTVQKFSSGRVLPFRPKDPSTTVGLTHCKSPPHCDVLKFQDLEHSILQALQVNSFKTVDVKAITEVR
eukprot:CAMPEP_0184304484 /NCGR_PEP_ID=MMETSP1049-20130417/13988_1 /TAXON_ID=77928 /ORGANISM="Proteomonas sulcata, Strain CCMP704" /LENGTH=140 /DNA_ID=CAMNT_0026616299 /DNA_START=917 /DNA_END=1339 /DNA_ORIENTATION=-